MSSVAQIYTKRPVSDSFIIDVQDTNYSLELSSHIVSIRNLSMDNLTISKVKGIAQYRLHYKDYTKTYYLSNCSNKKPKLLF